MIKKIFFLVLISCGLVLVESAASLLMDTRWRPDLSLLAVIFATLSLGFRYGFAMALTVGVLKESLTSQTLGLMLVSYLASAFLADYLKRHLSLQESLVSRLGIVVACLMAQIVIQAVFFAVHNPLEMSVLGMSIVLPQVFITILFSEFFFNLCRPCASKLFV